MLSYLFVYVLSFVLSFVAAAADEKPKRAQSAKRANTILFIAVDFLPLRETTKRKDKLNPPGKSQTVLRRNPHRRTLLYSWILKLTTPHFQLPRSPAPVRMNNYFPPEIQITAGSLFFSGEKPCWNSNTNHDSRTLPLPLRGQSSSISLSLQWWPGCSLRCFATSCGFSKFPSRDNLRKLRYEWNVNAAMLSALLFPQSNEIDNSQ